MALTIENGTIVAKPEKPNVLSIVNGNIVASKDGNAVKEYMKTRVHLEFDMLVPNILQKTGNPTLTEEQAKKLISWLFDNGIDTDIIDTDNFYWSLVAIGAECDDFVSEAEKEDVLAEMETNSLSRCDFCENAETCDASDDCDPCEGCDGCEGEDTEEEADGEEPAEEKVTPNFCSNCGRAVPKPANFCPACGNLL